MNLGNLALSPRLQANAFLSGISPQLAPGLAVGDFIIDCSNYTGTAYDPYPGAGSAPVALLANTVMAPLWFSRYSAFWSENPSTVTATMLDGTVVTLGRPVGTAGAAGGVAAVSVTPDSPDSDGSYIFRIIRITNVPSNPAVAYSGDVYELGVVIPVGAEPDPDPDPTPFNLVPQAGSRTFDVDAIDLPTMSSSALWEVWYRGALLDSATRFDRFGAGGWGVEPSSDFSTITVTVPRSAAIGEGYDARIRHGGGDFPTTSFIVTPAADPPALENTLMPHYLFSTGELTVSLPLPSPTLERRVIGAPGAATLPLANLLDADMATLADFTRTDGANYQYLIADMGSAKKIGRVIAGKVALGGGTLTAYVSAAKIVNGDFSGATALVAGSGALGADREYIPAANAASVTGRYLYLVPTAGTGVTIGDLDIRSEEWKIGTLQNTGINFSFQSKEARGGAAFNLLPSADAQYDGACALTSESLEADARAMNLFTGALIAGTNPQTITAGAKTKPLPFVAEYRTVDTQGRPFRAILYVCYAPGFTWSFKRDDFSASNFTAAVYLPDATARAWRIYLVQ